MCRQSVTVCLVKSSTRQHRAIGSLALRPFVAVMSFAAIGQWAKEAPQDALAPVPG
ncbi:hypothetical protein OH809_09770 [Streptomyces sp. NBC_00873]|uniref:hypothetical protein n=1 Tax=unclassified Streptomyces TaxID=2593676 RepID=UPI00386E352A|nr:hypothetical protein OH809_09770 [Streptomyces sp. NBC_00873]WTA47046.1 hypothetical protein OH821_34050 [Streptomyces sp. NBC_00842]